MYGELVPVGGGDPIPMMKKRLRIGRREGCDIVLNYGNVSSHHCLLEIEEGYWFVRDLRSRNGIKINGKIHVCQLNESPRTFDGVKIYTSDKWHTSFANYGKLSNLLITKL